MQNDNEYRTSDTSLAAYLLTEGFTEPSLEQLPNEHGGTRGVFIFTNDTTALQECIRKYQTGQASVEPATYLRNYRHLVRRAREGY